MSTFSTDDLKLIERTSDLYVAPFREDGKTYETFTRTWALVVDGKVYVRAANGQDSRWYRAAIAQTAGRVRVGDTVFDVAFERAGTDLDDAIDAAYKRRPPA